MKKVVLALLVCSMYVGALVAQGPIFAEEIKLPAGYTPTSVLMPPSPLSLQVLFVGGADKVQTTPTYGYEAGEVYAKEWHDFIGFTPDNTGESLGWISVNHEMIYMDNRIGDGGGMTAFRVKRTANGELEVVDQQLADGRKGKFFNVDFVNTVGETGMNCGGISSIVDGRIWTAEEWFRANNRDINSGQFSGVTGGAYPTSPGTAPNQGVRDTADFTIKSDIPGFEGVKIKKFENFNWMVEIDPRQAKAIRKQYNWGRQNFEGGVVAKDNRTVYLGPDATPGFWGRFIADTPGDFTKGKMYVYKHDAPNKWIEIDNKDPQKMLNFDAQALSVGATMYNRPEWVAIDTTTGKVYWTETGADDVGRRFGRAVGGVHDPAHVARAKAQGLDSPNNANYTDFYGRIWVYDPQMDSNYVFLEGGPDWNQATSPTEAEYPSTHLSNPDGLSVMYFKGKPALIICEDLNGRSWGRVPAGVSNSTCEVFLLDLGIKNPKIDDLVRLTAVPRGAEVTGACPTPDGKSLLLNSQHPATNNAFPWNHSLTFAIHGFDKVSLTDLKQPEIQKSTGFLMYPNPTTRTIYFNQAMDVAIYDGSGKRIQVMRNVNQADVSTLAPGMYYIQNAQGEVQKLVIQ